MRVRNWEGRGGEGWVEGGEGDEEILVNDLENFFLCF